MFFIFAFINLIQTNYIKTYALKLNFTSFKFQKKVKNMNQESQNSMTNTKTRQQIAQEYGVTPKTLKSWLY